MNFASLFFSFKGRINRKTYWLASLGFTLLGFAILAAITFAATGNAFAPEVWQRPAASMNVWVPVVSAYLIVIAWPSGALAVKRLHDRDRGWWLWAIYFVSVGAFNFIPQKQIMTAAASGSSPLIPIAFVVTIVFALFMIIELGFLPGTRGANRFGEATVAPRYTDNKMGFWSWMFGLDGRIGRAGWWGGCGVVAGLIFGMFVVIGGAFGIVMAAHPELMTPDFAAKFGDPIWLQTPEGQNIAMQFGFAVMVPSVLLLVAFWNLVALGVKRLHDRGLTGWLILVVIVPLIGLAIAPLFGSIALHTMEGLWVASAIWSVVQFGFLKGVTGPNKHGRDPQSGGGGVAEIFS